MREEYIPPARCARCGRTPVANDLPVCAASSRDILLDVLMDRERELAALRAAGRAALRRHDDGEG